MTKKENKSTKLIRILMLATIIVAAMSIISTSSALSVNLQPGQSINDITQLALGFDNNAELNLAPGNYTNVKDQDINTSSGNVTIKGADPNQKSIIDLQGLNRFFTVNTGGTLKLENLIIKNGKVSNMGNDGGTVRIDFGGKLIVNNCEFINSTGYLGGAIYGGRSSEISINHSIFRDNTAVNGGALCFYNEYTFTKNINIINSKFFNNRADTGGAIYNRHNHLVISGCDLYNNSAGISGGAIHNQYTLMHIYDSLLYNNSAIMGGAYEGTYGDLVVNNSYFISNNAAAGGAIALVDGTLDVSFSKFYDNSATEHGGAIYTWLTERTNIIFSDFIGNRADYGGAIYNSGSSITYISTFFMLNLAYIAGNDIYEG